MDGADDSTTGPRISEEFIFCHVVLSLLLVHYITYLPYYAEVLTFVTFGHFFVFRIVRNNVNAVFITL